jgi:hypothetical protein
MRTIIAFFLSLVSVFAADSKPPTPPSQKSVQVRQNVMPPAELPI